MHNAGRIITCDADVAEGVDWLARQDRRWRDVMQQCRPLPLRRRPDGFAELLSAIVSQQVSTASAAAIWARMEAAGLCDAERMAVATGDELRAVGLSRQKQVYVRDLSERFLRGEVPTRRFARMTDEQIIQSLLPIKGVGRWTAEMFLIFVLNRPDVWPVDDLGVRKMAQEVYGMEQLPSARALLPFAEHWRPCT